VAPDPTPSLNTRLTRLKTHVHTLWLAWTDPRTPWYAKAMLALVLAFIASPIDPIPDFIPVIGYLDDLLVLMLGMYLAVRLIPEPVLADCRARAEREEAQTENRALRRIGTALVILLWATLLAGAVWVAKRWREG